MECLLDLRQVCEEYMDESWFQNAQDRVFMQSVCAACKDKTLWTFMATSYKFVFEPAEVGRRWGMVCECPEHVDARRVDHVHHIECPLNSRRLHSVPKFLDDTRSERKEALRTMTPADAEGCQEVFVSVQNMLKRMPQAMDARFAYMKTLPWRFSTADTVEGAEECVKLYQKRPREQHDALTNTVWDEVGQAIEARANGQCASAALLDLVQVVKDSPLNESCGEGLPGDMACDH